MFKTTKTEKVRFIAYYNRKWGVGCDAGVVSEGGQFFLICTVIFLQKTHWRQVYMVKLKRNFNKMILDSLLIVVFITMLYD